MRMKKFTYDPGNYQNHIDAENANKDLSGAIHVQTYTKDEKIFGGDQTIVIFAFYPDEEIDIKKKKFRQGETFSELHKFCDKFIVETEAE